MINISEILANPSVMKEYKVEPEFNALRLKRNRYPVSYKEPFILSVYNEAGRVRIKGKTKVRLLMPCDRCLDEVEYTFPVSIDYRLSSDREADGMRDADGTDMGIIDINDCSFLDGCMLDVDRLVTDEIVVALPTKVLCKEDCKGLCGICGMNLNHGTCDCDQSLPDPRMAGILDLFHDFYG